MTTLVHLQAGNNYTISWSTSRLVGATEGSFGYRRESVSRPTMNAARKAMLSSLWLALRRSLRERKVFKRFWFFRGDTIGTQLTRNQQNDSGIRRCQGENLVI